MIYQALGTLVAAIVIAVSSFFFGVRYESGQNAMRTQEAVNKAVIELRTEMKAQEQKAVKAAEIAAEKRYKAREVKREIANLPNRVECDWNPDEQRLLNDLHESYYDAKARSSSVQNQVRRPTKTN